MSVDDTEISAYEEHSVDVVDISVLPATVEEGIFWYCDFGTVEYGWLSSAVSLTFQTQSCSPHSCHSRCTDSKQIPVCQLLRSLTQVAAHSPNIHLEHPGPPIPTLWIEKVDPDTTSRPTPAFEFTPVSPFYQDIQFFSIGIDPIVVCSLDVRVNDRYHLFVSFTLGGAGVDVPF